MNYSISQKDSIQIIQVKHLINEHENQVILKEVQNKIEDGCNRFVLDLQLLDFMNSVGLNFLISALTRSRKNGGELLIANASGQVENLLEITKLKPLFNLNPSVDAAVNQFIN